MFGQLVTSPPVLNTAFLSGVNQDASVCTLRLSSDDIKSSSSTSIAISEAHASGSTTATMSRGDFSHAINFTVVQLGAPTLQVDYSEQQALPPSTSPPSTPNKCDLRMALEQVHRPEASLMVIAKPLRGSAGEVAAARWRWQLGRRSTCFRSTRRRAWWACGLPLQLICGGAR